MDNKNISSEAFLSNDGDMTSFRYGNSNIRFRTPKRLKRFTEVKEWDNGYIVVMADYEGILVIGQVTNLPSQLWAQERLSIHGQSPLNRNTTNEL